MSDFDPTDVLAVEAREAKQKAEQKRLADQEADDLKWLMSDKRGRRIIWRLFAFTEVFSSPWRGTSETDFRCGAANVGLKYLGDVNEYCPERYNQMVTEQVK